MLFGQFGLDRRFFSLVVELCSVYLRLAVASADRLQALWGSMGNQTSAIEKMGGSFGAAFREGSGFQEFPGAVDSTA